MKNLIAIAIAILFFCETHAQTRITKDVIVGKWTIAAIDMKGIFYYEVEKDSVSISETLRSRSTDAAQIRQVEAMVRMQAAQFAKMSFQFNADNTAVLNGGASEAVSNATYSVDEKKSTITTVETSGDNRKETLNADMLHDKLRIMLPNQQPEITLVLKKS